MITRYEDDWLAKIWSDEARVHRWGMVEQAIASIQGDLGLIPAEAALAIQQAPWPNQAMVASFEAELHHDVAAFVQAFSAGIPAGSRRWVHFRVTSSDLVDTGNALALGMSLEHLHRRTAELWSVLGTLTNRYRDTPRLGRTHGQAASETTFGNRVGVAFGIVGRAMLELERAMEEVRVGKVLGPVGMGDRLVSERVCERLGLRAEVVATQIVPRDRYLAAAWACLRTVIACEDWATEIRLAAQEGVAEVAEPFADGQMGSSSMPHKRNPVRCERVCGVSRLARGYFQALAESVVTWNERDIAHSSVERVALVDLLHLTAFAVTEMLAVTEGLDVDHERMAWNLAVRRPAADSADDLAEAIESGKDRHDAYREIQATHRLKGRTDLTG
jgi:adenylosuccinate lyase